jgi:Amt family ammonium transporter
LPAAGVLQIGDNKCRLGEVFRLGEEVVGFDSVGDSKDECIELTREHDAALIGVAAGACCYLGIKMKNRFRYDDSLDVVGIHGVGGVIGLLATGLFSSKAVNPNGADGLFFGNASQLGIQTIAILVTIIYVFAVSFVILKIVDKIFGLRVPDHDEVSGLDLTQHDETAYTSH